MKVIYHITGSALGRDEVHEELEIPDQYLAGLDDQKRDELIDKWVEEEVNEHVQVGWDPA